MSSIIGTPWDEFDRIEDDGLRCEVEYKIADGWDSDEVESEHVILKRLDLGKAPSVTKQVVIFLLTAGTFGLGNLVAHRFARRRHRVRTVVLLEDPS